jgi:hypothetical protein
MLRKVLNRTHALSYSMPALCGSAAAVLRTGPRLSAGEQHGHRVLVPCPAHGHLRQLQVFPEWPATNDY